MYMYRNECLTNGHRYSPFESFGEYLEFFFNLARWPGSDIQSPVRYRVSPINLCEQAIGVDAGDRS